MFITSSYPRFHQILTIAVLLDIHVYPYLISSFAIILKNKSFENKIIDVLVENKLKDQNKFFGRNKYMSSVIFNGTQKNIGKIVKIKIESSNQNNLFGKILNSTKEKAA